MEVSILQTIYSQFKSQNHQYGLLFGYTSQNENHIISYLAPQTFQQLGSELTEDKKNDIINLAEDLHNAANGYSLIGFIAKESESITQQALTMKVQEYYVSISKRLKIKGSFYLCYVNSESYSILEKKQGQVFTKVNHKEIQQNELITVNAKAPLNVEQVLSEKDAGEKLLVDKITQESQIFIESLQNSNTVLVNNILISNESKNISELISTPLVKIQFIESGSSQQQEQYYVRPYYFRFSGCFSINFQVHKNLSFASIKSIIANSVRKELEVRIYQVFGDKFGKKTIQDAEEIQLPAKYVNTQFNNITLSAYISHSSIQDYGSCIYPTILDVENIYISEFSLSKVELQAVDVIKISQSGDSLGDISKKVDTKEQKNKVQAKSTQQQLENETKKQQISYLIFGAVMLLLSYIYTKI